MLTADRDTRLRDATRFVFDVAAETILYAGALVALDSDGNAVPAGTEGAVVVVGKAIAQVDNHLGLAGALQVEVSRGCFNFESAEDADELARADIGLTCYAVNDHIVAKTSASNARLPAGIVRDVDALGVWVEL